MDLKTRHLPTILHSLVFIVMCFLLLLQNDNLLQPTINGGPVENVGFIHAFIASISVILVSEIGDKTFFIAAIMAMRHPRLIVFCGAISALILMTILSGRCTKITIHIPMLHTTSHAVFVTHNRNRHNYNRIIFTALFGWLANVIPKAYTFYISTALFAIFGLKMLKEGYHMSESEAQEELEEVQTDLRKKEEEVK